MLSGNYNGLLLGEVDKKMVVIHHELDNIDTIVSRLNELYEKGKQLQQGIENRFDYDRYVESKEDPRTPLVGSAPIAVYKRLVALMPEKRSLLQNKIHRICHSPEFHPLKQHCATYEELIQVLYDIQTLIAQLTTETPDGGTVQQSREKVTIWENLKAQFLRLSGELSHDEDQAA